LLVSIIVISAVLVLAVCDLANSRLARN
jgi:hypothetical protein